MFGQSWLLGSEVEGEIERACLWKFLLSREHSHKHDIVLDELCAPQTISHENYGTDHLGLVVNSCTTQSREHPVQCPGNDEVSYVFEERKPCVVLLSIESQVRSARPRSGFAIECTERHPRRKVR